MNKNNLVSKIILYTIIMFIVIILLTIGYSAFSDSLTISDSVTHVRVDKVVRINGVTSSSANASNLDYSSKDVYSTVYIPAGGSITYNVTVTNLGNVPVAITNVTTSSGNNTLSNVTANITSNNYVKVCDNGNCTNGVSVSVPVTITNNGNAAIDTDIKVDLTFTEVYTITYENTQLGEVLAGSNYSYRFSNNGAPSRLNKVSGTCGSFTYNNRNLNITNIGSDIVFTQAYVIYLNVEGIGTVSQGQTFTHTFTEWPVSITADSGTYGNVTYQNHTLTVTNVRSNVSLTGVYGSVAITNVTHVQGSDKNVASATTPTYSGMDVNFSVVFQRPEGSTETDFETVYQVEITNTHYNDYIFRGLDFSPNITASADSDTATLDLTPIGITNGEVIASGATKTFQVKLSLITNNPDGSYTTQTGTTVDTTPDTEEETGTITATISPSTGDLTSPNTRAAFTVTATNTYTSQRTFRLVSSNSNLEFIDAYDTVLGDLNIAGETTRSYTVYVRAVSGATFISSPADMTVYLSTAGSANTLVGYLDLDVDVYAVPDTTKVTVGNAELKYQYDTTNKVPTIKATWDRIDIGGTPVVNYGVYVYNSSNTKVAECETHSSTRECVFTNLSENTTYYAIVFGEDQAENSGKDDIGNATTNNGYATRSPNATFKWRYNVNTNNVSNLAVGGDGATAILGASHTITVTASGSSNNIPYTAPDSVTVTMDGSSGNFYTYGRSGSNNTVGTITIPVVTGNISVTAQRAGGCLIEGTKILLASGKYKNIEDIKYDDLVMAYSYYTGELVPVYPIFIETAINADKYQKTTFSDGTVLKTYNYHGVYDTELKRFVSVDNPKEFHVGTKIAKISKNGKGYEEITVTKIEEIHESARFYLFATTKYFNTIANDILTTDGNLALSNLYGFNDNITWPKQVRDYSLQDVYAYDELADVMPYYMYKGMRAGEGKFLTNFGLDLSTYRQFIKMINDERIIHPINNLGRNMWMVTTSLDNVTELNKHNYLYPEGYIYTLPENKGVISWTDTSENKTYKPGDKVTVYHGIHFVANYK